MAAQVGIDTGGTFTDVIAYRQGRTVVAKVPSTPTDPGTAIQRALEAVSDGVPTPCALRHGTTVGTNAVLTRSGARVAFVTTAGVEGLLAVGRGNRGSLHELQPSREAPLVTARDTWCVAERIGADGAVVTRLTATEARRVAAGIAKSGAQAVAITLLHATRNDTHERMLQRAFRSLGVPVSVSSELSADAREVERATTAVLDAYAAPVMGQYIARLRDALPAYVTSFQIMRSDGGRMTPEAVMRAPVRTLLSGPAAGVAAAAQWAQRLGLARAVSFDMGGTSTDVAWIENGQARVRPALNVGPWQAGVSSIAIETVGAGGGSIVSVDAGGALRVGPESAGADPGPACYGNAGPLTVTDVWLARGQVPDRLADGTLTLDAAQSHAAAQAAARQARMPLATFLDGAAQVAATATAAAVRKASAARGNDPQGATLIAFGGAGPVQACAAAQVLGMRHVVVPPHPGALAAMGTLVVPLRADAEVQCDRASAATALTEQRDALDVRVRALLQDQGGHRVVLVREIEARFVGQAYAITVRFDRGWRARFREAHQAQFGFVLDTPIEPVRLRVRGEAQERGAKSVHTTARHTAPRRARAVSAGVIARERLTAATYVKGPLRIEEPTATTWVPSGWRAYIDALACLHVVAQ